MCRMRSWDINGLTPETVDTDLHDAVSELNKVLASMTADANPCSSQPKVA